ncbi:twin-arginine translocation signal domain-containing protein [Marinobacter orientalis]|uniref:Twin-arginine translocation signal domain-containing protein n=1 Tax=Marinobacter orientalis TaxID=1928859 RepID=A0A7Y0RBI6_9GAMM|nr:twin-arginine translocation signal domain-containing protein [Marinobacter orientalis]NMT63187.1 twin-arginine translocation signal domain-containing protein [Marinobacter orientalis]TGX51841.1 twin-arginine translocation signal domain-containing protein [Marinobacter orientalis]
MDNQKRENSRRSFLRMAATAVPAAVAVAVAPNAAARVVKQDAPKSSGLRDTEHTRKYLESARF